MNINSIRQKTSQYEGFIKLTGSVFVWGCFIAGAFILGELNDLAFHTASELFTVTIAFSAFIIVLNTYNLSHNSYMTFLGIAFGFVSIFELLHVLAYAGTDIFLLNDQDINLLLSILPRLLQSLSILLSFIFIKRHIHIAFTITTYSVITVGAILLIYFNGTSLLLLLKGVSFSLIYQALEAIAALAFTLSLLVLFLIRKSLKARIYKYMLLSLIASLSADVLLMMATGIAGQIYVAAHILKFIAFFCIYKAVIQNTLRNPMDAIFSELDMVKNELAEKHREISQANEKLKHDISDLHMVEKLLRKSKAWSRSIFEGSPIGIALLTTSGVVIEANPALERILGYSCSEMRDIGIGNITHMDDIEKDSRLFDDLIDGTMESYQIEKRYIRKDNKIIWTNVKMSYIQNVGEDFQFIIAMIEDITHQKENEQKQHQLVTRLEETNKELDNFAYIVSHDLKAPLRGIGSLANWLVTDYKDKLNQEGAEIIDLLVNRVERMKNFIDGILQYSRVSRVKESPVEVDLNKVVREVIELLAPPENIHIQIKTQLPVIKGERIHIEQVFQNLISNAVKFMDKPEGKIEIACEDLGADWEFSITDNGSGIDEKYFHKIFMIFQTLQPRDKFESTGIGLSIVKKIIETSGGKIWLESELKKGTTFYFTLPKTQA